jgi:hypothetical protein
MKIQDVLNRQNTSLGGTKIPMGKSAVSYGKFSK